MKKSGTEGAGCLTDRLANKYGSVFVFFLRRTTPASDIILMSWIAQRLSAGVCVIELSCPFYPPAKGLLLSRDQAPMSMTHFCKSHTLQLPFPVLPRCFNLHAGRTGTGACGGRSCPREDNNLPGMTQFS